MHETEILEMKKCFLVVFILIFSINLSYTQELSKVELEELAFNYSQKSFQELKAFLSIPNDAHFLEEIHENIAWCEKAFHDRGFLTKKLKTKEAPLLLATKNFTNTKNTVLIYLQIDGQPVDSIKWNQKNPYTATLKKRLRSSEWETINWEKINGHLDMDWRVFARSVSDAKGPVVMFLTAMDIINDLEYEPNYNIKVIMDFEEELGSPRLPKAVNDYKNELYADMLLIFDGPRHVSNQPTLLFGARGISRLSLEVFGPKVPQHSGHYGNYVPNPALKLSQLLGSMLDQDGRVIIPKWYDNIVISEVAKQQMSKVPDDERKIRQELGISTIDYIGRNYQESLQYPSLSILGLKSAWVGDETRTVIPSSAKAELNIRLVKETKGEHMVNLVKTFIKNQGYHFVDSIPTDEERAKYSKLIKYTYANYYEAFRTDFNSEIGIWLRKAMERAFGKEPVQLRTTGGSIPISPFVNVLNIPAVIVPTVNKDNNQHSPNENLRVGNYIDGIRTITAILTEKL